MGRYIITEVLNPLNGLFQLVARPDPTDPDNQLTTAIAQDYGCYETSQVGDVVAITPLLTDHVTSLTTNVYQNLALGVIIRKPSDTVATVLISGKLDDSAYGLMGLTAAQPAFIGTDGRMTTTPPSSGHRQIMGLAISASRMVLIPSMTKTVLAS